MKKEWLRREARIITENWDEKYASGFKNGDSDDYMKAIAEQVQEKHEYLRKSRRNALVRQINEMFDTSLDLTDLTFIHHDNEIELMKELPARGCFRLNRRLGLDEMPSGTFRETIGECLAIIPGGLQRFRKLAEISPYIF